MNDPISTRVGAKHTLLPSSEQTPPQVYCDGLSGITLTAATCKLRLHQIVDAKESGEQRQLVQTLVMPTAAVVDMCNWVLRAISANPDGIRTAIAELQAKLVVQAATEPPMNPKPVTKT